MGRPAGMPLPLVYGGGSAGQWGRSRPLYSIQKSFLVFPGRNLSPAIHKWRAEGQSCGEREGICPSRLGLVLSPKLASPCYFSLSPANLSQFSFLSPAEDLEIGNSWRVCPAPRRVSPSLRLCGSQGTNQLGIFIAPWPPQRRPIVVVE